MPKKYIYIIATLFIILFGLFFVYIKVSVAPTARNQPEKQNSQPSSAPQGQTVSLMLDFGNGISQKTLIELKQGMTVLDALKIALQTLNINSKIKDSSMGAYIDSIGDMQGGQDGKYWMNYVNGALSQTSADKTILKAGDTVEWKFEKPAF